MPHSPRFTTLKNRGLIHLEGPDRHDFLQGLITNNISKLSPGTPIYACLLSAQGKFLHDFFVIEGDGFTLLDCEGGQRAQDLYKRLNMYRLRKDVQISVEEHNTVYASFGSEQGLPDPRTPEMGHRSFEKPEGLEECPFEEWDKHRIALTIPDGSRDLIPERSTMDEARMDKLGAIDYDKGCYIGQELTARMHYRGLGKKHLYVVSTRHPEAKPKDLMTQEQVLRVAQDDNIIYLESLPAPLSEIRQDGKIIGEMRSSCGDTGLALLKDDAV